MRMRMRGMRRREFITLGAGAAAWPLKARAQQAGIPTVGFLSGTSAATGPYFADFVHGLNDAGYVDGRNIAVEPRWAEGQYDRMPTLAAELVRRPVTVVVAANLPALLAAKAATSDDADRIFERRRPCAAWLSRQSHPAGRQYYGCELLRRRACP